MCKGGRAFLAVRFERQADSLGGILFGYGHWIARDFGRRNHLPEPQSDDRQFADSRKLPAGEFAEILR